MHIVIIGGGHAGAQALATLCARGWPGTITLLSEEPCLPYQRPPLSKQFLDGTLDRAALPLYDSASYQVSNVDVKLDSSVSGIDPHKRIAIVDGCPPITYDYLVIATGARARTLECPGSNCDGILYLRSLYDAEQLRSRLHRSSRVVVVGGGYIGLEISATAAKAGLPVTVLEASDRILNRVASPEVSDYFQSLHEKNGVHIFNNTCVEGFVPDTNGQVSEVITSHNRHPADLVIVGVGASPNIELARDAGIEVGRGIHVDEYCRTNIEDVFAAGDCTEFMHCLYGNIHLENIQNANDQARTVVDFICDAGKPYHAIPWFWSDQYKTRLQLCGLPCQTPERVIRGNPENGSFSVWHLTDGRVTAVESVDNSRDFVAGKKIIEGDKRLSADVISDTLVSLKELI